MKIERMDSREIRAELSTPCYRVSADNTSRNVKSKPPFRDGGNLIWTGRLSALRKSVRDARRGAEHADLGSCF